MKMIKLTKYYGGYPVYLNPQLITVIYSPDQEGTKIYLAGSDEFVVAVEESAEEVVTMLSRL